MASEASSIMDSMLVGTGLIPCKERDFLEQDDEIRGQRFFCMSTISPEDVLMRKDTFMFNRFLTHFASDLDKFFTNTMEKFKDDAYVLDSLKAVKERYAYVTSAKELQEEFDYFKNANNQNLEKEFHELESFQTTIRGIKVRGVYDTLEEARSRAQKLSKKDKSFNVYIGQVGCWCPWSPYPDQITDQEFAETALNTLMHKYKESEALKEEMYRIRKEEMAARKIPEPGGVASSSTHSESESMIE